jgi:hypothetical protein
MEALNKLAAEAAPEELKVVLGWLFDSRRLRISLPDNKAIAWTKEIEEMLEAGRASAKRLEKNIGRYVNISQIIPMIHHFFLNRLQCLQRRATKRRGAIKLNKECIADLEFLKRTIELANKGMSMHMIAYCLPERIYINERRRFRMAFQTGKGLAL